MLVPKTFYYIYSFMLCVWEHMPQHTCRWQRTPGSWFSASTVWVPRTKLRSPGLVTSAFAHWATSLALPDFASTLTVYSTYPKHLKHLFLSGALVFLVTTWFSSIELSDADEMSPRVRVLTSKSDNWNSILRIHMIKGDNQLPHAVPPHTCPLLHKRVNI